MNKWECTICDYVYREESGEDKKNVKPGTRWTDVPDDFRCPGCGTEKGQFYEESMAKILKHRRH